MSRLGPPLGTILAAFSQGTFIWNCSFLASSAAVDPADYSPNEQPIWRPRRHDSHQTERSARAGRLRDQLEPCRLVDDRCVSENLGLRRIEGRARNHTLAASRSRRCADYPTAPQTRAPGTIAVWPSDAMGRGLHEPEPLLRAADL